jgi:hypothetical protein
MVYHLLLVVDHLEVLVVVVQMGEQDFLLPEQEIHHQHPHHKEIMVVSELLLALQIMVRVVAVVPVVLVVQDLLQLLEMVDQEQHLLFLEHQ